MYVLSVCGSIFHPPPTAADAGGAGTSTKREETTSSSRIFIKILMQEISESLGLAKLKQRFTDPFMTEMFAGLFPRDKPRNTVC